MATNMKLCCFRVSVDFVCICVVVVPVLLINMLAQPFQRGFFCDDQSLMHPLHDDTVPTWLLVLVATGLPVACVLLVEKLRCSTPSCMLDPMETGSAARGCKEASYRNLVTFFFGAAITQLLTEVSKYSLGRLRPHFMSVCQPSPLPANCSAVFITDDLCTSTDAVRLKQARLSFPSGHASMAMFSAAFLILYLQQRLSCSQARLVRPIVQLFVFVLAFFTCLSRVSDFKHHWSDVLGGALLGILVCLLIALCLRDFHTLIPPAPPGSGRPHKEQMSLYAAQEDRSSSSEMHTEQDVI